MHFEVKTARETYQNFHEGSSKTLFFFLKTARKEAEDFDGRVLKKQKADRNGLQDKCTGADR